ncbi:MAG: transglycosylase SLT domain-containing protein, partial [Myxococcales bacterium]
MGARRGRGSGGAKALLWLCTGAAAALVATGFRPTEPPRPGAELELAALKERINGLEQKLDETRRALEQKTAELEQRLAVADEASLWQEAAELGVVRELARHRTGLSPRQEARLAAVIVREARANTLDPLLVTALIRIESTFNNFAVSDKGAMGLMQIMPDTGEWLAK